MYLAMGLTKKEFFHSTPKILKAYEEAHKIKLMEMDRVMWMMCGNYVVSAVAVAVEACLAGKKAKGKFIDKPVLEKIEEENRPLDEEEIERQRELFVAKLCAMKVNFDLNHKDKEAK